MKNFYPELPIVQYKKTTVEMTAVINYLKSYQTNYEVKRATYIVFRNESANGTKGLNNNYGGFQADSGRWQERFNEKFLGVVIKKENKTGIERGFLAFKSWEGSIDMLLSKITERGIYIGGNTHLVTKIKVENVNQLAETYLREWVTGNPKYMPEINEIRNFLSMYRQAESLFI